MLRFIPVLLSKLEMPKSKKQRAHLRAARLQLSHKLSRATPSPAATPATEQQIEEPHSNQPSTSGVTLTIDLPTSSPVQDLSDSDSDFYAEEALRSDQSDQR